MQISFDQCHETSSSSCEFDSAPQEDEATKTGSEASRSFRGHSVMLKEPPSPPFSFLFISFLQFSQRH
jgi:hypothetical protein